MFQYTPGQLRYIADVCDAMNAIPKGNTFESDEARIEIGSVSIVLPEAMIARIVYDWKYEMWGIDLTQP